MKPYKPITSHESLLSFGIWYTERYIPSRKKLEDILRKKCANFAWIDAVLTSLESYIDDRKNLESRITSELARGTPVRKLLGKYLLKGFQKEDILFVIESLPQDGENRLSSVAKKLERMLASGKSKRTASMDLEVLYSEFKSEIKDMMQNYPSDEEQLFSHFANLQGKTDKKTYESLVRRGFSYESVKKFLGSE